MARNIVNKFELAKQHAEKVKSKNPQESIETFLVGFNVAKIIMRTDIQTLGDWVKPVTDQSKI